MYRLAAICSDNYELEDEAERWYKNAAVRGHIASQKALAVWKRFVGEEKYMWAYLAYLCGGTKNLGNKPDSRDYNLAGILASREDELNAKRHAESKAKKIYDDIQRHRQNNNS